MRILRIGKNLVALATIGFNLFTVGCESSGQPETYVVEVDDTGDDTDSSGDGSGDGPERESNGTGDDDGSDDQGHSAIYCADGDDDGYGDPNQAIAAESVTSGYVADCTDCNDDSSSVHPGASDTVVDGVDSDCDGAVDDGAVTTTWYRDADGDNYGTSATTTSASTQPTGYVSNALDCNDATAAVSPADTEITGNGIDDDCNAATSDTATTTSTTWYRDADGDGYGTSATTTSATTAPSGYVSNALDCNDATAAVSPADTEVTGNGIDDDCNSSTSDTATTYTWYRDADGDGYGTSSTTSVSATQPPGYVANSSDCNDGSAAVSPVDVEVTGNGIDDDCNAATSDTATSSDGRTTWYATGVPDSSSTAWNLSIANVTASDWSKWFATSATSTGTTTQSFSGKTGDQVYVNGLYSSGWLFENTGTACQEHLSTLSFGTTNPATTSYSITTATSGADCACQSNGSGGYNGVCTLR